MNNASNPNQSTHIASFAPYQQPSMPNPVNITSPTMQMHQDLNFKVLSQENSPKFYRSDFITFDEDTFSLVFFSKNNKKVETFAYGKIESSHIFKTATYDFLLDFYVFIIRKGPEPNQFL